MRPETPEDAAKRTTDEIANELKESSERRDGSDMQAGTSGERSKKEIPMKPMNMFVKRVAGVAALAPITAVCYIAVATAQSQLPFAYPKAGQSQQQTTMDSQECQGWAQQQTNFNPQQAENDMLRQQQAQQQQAAQAQQQQQAAASRQGGLMGGAARGAALGAVGGAIGGDAGKGAAIGAGVGALAGGMRRRSAQREAQASSQQMQAQLQQQQSAQQAQFQQRLGAYNSAYAVCMGSRNYTVQ